MLPLVSQKCFQAVHVPLSLCDMLFSWENRTLWKAFYCDGDGSWIYRCLYLKLLVIVHDGLYMPEVTKDVCYCEFVVCCRLNKQFTYCTWAENTTHANTAGNYPGESFGGIGAQILMKAALSGCMMSDAITLTF